MSTIVHSFCYVEWKDRGIVEEDTNRDMDRDIDTRIDKVDVYYKRTVH